jgi:hypothetical protein
MRGGIVSEEMVRCRLHAAKIEVVKPRPELAHSCRYDVVHHTRPGQQLWFQAMQDASRAARQYRCVANTNIRTSACSDSIARPITRVGLIDGKHALVPSNNSRMMRDVRCAIDASRFEFVEVCRFFVPTL